MTVFGEASRIGFLLGLEDAGSSTVEAIFEDYQYETQRALSAFNKLITVDKVQAIVVLGTPASAAIVPLSEAKQIPLFSWTSSTRVSKDHPHVLRLMPSGDLQGAAIAEAALERDYKRVTFFSSANEYSQYVRDGFLKHFPEQEVLSREEFPPDTQDFRTALLLAKSRGTQGLGLCLNTVQIASFAKQARELGLNAPIFGCHMMSSDEMVRGVQSALEGSWFIEGRVNPILAKRFQARSKDTGGLWQAGAFYDLAKLMAQTQKEGVPVSRLLDSLIGRCLEQSGFSRNCVVRNREESYFELEMGVTKISSGTFSR